jgi:hypothetical protein
MIWEPVRVPDRYLEPREPVEWFCPTCELDSQDCQCGTCDACGERTEVSQYKIEDDESWLCDACQEGQA